MPFLIVQRYNGSLSALTRSSPADGEKNLHRRIFLFQGGIAIFNSHAVVFISPNLAELGCRREYRHDKNTAYSGSLDARRNNQRQTGLTIVLTICCWLLRLASKEPEYAVFLSCLYSLRQPSPARLGEMNTTAWLLKMAIPS